MPISYKNKIYTTLGTPTDLSGNGAFATNSAGVPAKDYTVKGRTIVWNQLLDKSKYPATTTSSGVTLTNNGDGTITVNGTASSNITYDLIKLSDKFGIVGHKYFVCGCPSGGSYDTYRITASIRLNGVYKNGFSDDGTKGGNISPALSSEETIDIYISISSGYTANNLIFKPQLFDLTQMFGAGNEPATPEEFRAMFPDDYYPYNAGELKSIAPTSVEASGIERFQMLDKSKFTATTTIGGVTFTNNGDGTITLNGTSSALINYSLQSGLKVVAGHKYFSYVGETNKIDVLLFANSDPYGTFDDRFPKPAGGISTALKNSDSLYYQPKPVPNMSFSNFILKPQFFDLTEMFGAGNEPATPDEFWQRVPEKLYGYNPNDYKSANIPSSKYFPDGMKSAGSVYDEINFLSQKAIKRIGAVDLGTLDWTYLGNANDRYFSTLDISDIKKISTTSEMPGLLNVIYTAFPQSNWYLNKPCMFKIVGNTTNFCISDPNYTDPATFKAAMSGVMLYYELATPVETAITPPLQVLQTFKGFTSFSAPNSLMQNGPLSVAYYAEGGANPEKGWLTSYKRKLYMGRNIEWNQLLDKSKFRATVKSDGITARNNGDGTFTINGTKEEGGDTTWIWFYDGTENVSLAKKLYGHKILYGCVQNPSSGPTNNAWGIDYEINTQMTNGAFTSSNLGESAVIATLDKVAASDITKANFHFYFRPSSSGPSVYKDVVVRPQLFDLTQMFGAGNEPSTPEEFWSYFDHKLYPYNPGETQPLFKISRKSRGGAKHYTARWDKVNAAMTRLNDAASFPTDTSNFGNFGSVNPNYDNPFDSIYPWSGIRICNIDLDAYMALQPGDSITKCVKAWEGDPDFDRSDDNGVWRYRPEFWGSSWDDGTYRYFDVTDRPAGGYVHYPEAIAGCWHGRAVTRTVNGEPTTCLLPCTGIPTSRTPLSTLHTYAKNYGATLDSIYSIDADLLLLTVEYATMNSQNAIGNGVTNLYRQGGYQIAAAATDSNVIKVLAADAGDYFIYGAIVDIGTTDGGNQVGTYYVTATAPDTDPTYLNVTLTANVTVTRENYWSIHGIINDPYKLQNFRNKSGYIGTNGRAMAFYRGMELYGNMWFYTLGAYENAADNHIWIAADAGQADAYDALDTSVHIDTGLVLPTSAGYIQTLGLPQRSGLLALPPFCTAVGGSSTNPVGDYSYNGDYTYNTVLLRGGSAYNGSGAGALCGSWDSAASSSTWDSSARPLLKTPQGVLGGTQSP